MPLGKEDHPRAERKAKAEEPAKVVLGRDKPELSPSAYALDKVGAADPDAAPEKEAKRAERYQAEKAKRRWGY